MNSNLNFHRSDILKNIFILIILVLFVLLLSACGKQTSFKQPKNNPSSFHNPTQNGGIVAGRIEASIQENVSNNKVSFQFTVKNQTESAQHLSIPTSKQFDFTITNSKGEEVYRYSKGKMFNQVIKNISLNQGEELHYSADVEGLKPDTYTIQFVWSGKNDVSANKTFTIN